MEAITAVLLHIGISLKSTVIQVLVLLGPGIALAAAIQLVSTNVTRMGVGLMGFPFYYVTCPGTMLHELSHALMCVIFRHRINEMSLFNPDHKVGSLGYVNHSYNPNSLYQVLGMFFIGVAPVIVGSLVIYAAGMFLVSPDFFASMNGVMPSGDVSWTEIPGAILPASESFLNTLLSPGNFRRWQFYVFIYLLISIGGNLRLSVADIRGASVGFLLFFVILFLFNIIALLFGGISLSFFVEVSQLYSFFYVIMFASLFMNILFLLPLLLLRMIKRR